MSGPFSPVTNSGTPQWSAVESVDGNFSSIIVGGGTSISEVGYGQGGYGEDGFDAPAVNLPAAATPDWQVEITK
jgi:hypothetical protein